MLKRALVFSAAVVVLLVLGAVIGGVDLEDWEMPR